MGLFRTYRCINGTYHAGYVNTTILIARQVSRLHRPNRISIESLTELVIILPFSFTLYFSTTGYDRDDTNGILV
jgi:hypothetical protein